MAFRSVPVISTNSSAVNSLTLVCSLLMMGGIDSTIPLLSRIMGYSSCASSIQAYSTPVFITLSIQSTVFSSSSPSGWNSNSPGLVVYVTGNSTTLRSCMPMATFLRFLPWVTCSFSCTWMRLLMRASSNSMFLMTAVTKNGLTLWVFSSIVTL